jgi:hypothetical protein
MHTLSPKQDANYKRFRILQKNEGEGVCRRRIKGMRGNCFGSVARGTGGSLSQPTSSAALGVRTVLIFGVADFASQFTTCKRLPSKEADSAYPANI